MAKKGKKLTPLQSEYRKQQKRIENFIKRGEKRGYHFQKGLVPEMPKRVTRKALEDIKSINAPYLYHRSWKTIGGNKEVNGRIIPGTRIRGDKAQARERKEAARKAKETRLARELQRKYHLDDETANKDAKALLGKVNAETIRITKEVPRNPLETPHNEVERIRKELSEAERKLAEYEEKYGTENEIEDERLINNTGRQIVNTINENNKDARDKYYKQEQEYRPNNGGELPKTVTNVLDQVRELIETWEPLPTWSEYWANHKRDDVSSLKTILNGAILLEGEEKVAARMQHDAEEIIAIAEYVCFTSDGREDVNNALVRFSTIIMGRTLSLEENSYMTDMSESFQKYN